MSKRNRIMLLATAALLVGACAGQALATEVPNSAAVFLRVFNDCPISIVTVNNDYPTMVSIEDVKNNCGGGYANLHVWRFSQDGAAAQEFLNENGFRFSADVTVSGTGEAESGLQISPWWSPLVDGRFNIRTTDGEIACFGGRLPFYSFTGSQGVTYVKGTTITMEMEYLPNGLSEDDPATVEYKLDYDGSTYTSGPLAFDMGNPDEDPPHGLWGMLTPATAGGHFQFFLQEGADDALVLVEWANIDFEDLGDAVANDATTWSQVKTLYR